ncbi:protein FAM32A-like [Littorina saxatilis]|uniref:Protein FAM32A n=1 Tax=Littorina saxatilis TaxID=31220 RepID=A0AAN9B845_9CAEN
MSAYDAVQKGGLKLKGVSDHGSKKKKKKDKQKEKLKEAVSLQQEQEQQTMPERPVSTKTPAELAFERRKWKKLEEQLVDRAAKSHKDRIMDFNKHLDSLSEHFDIPKVSWTK